MNEIEEHHKMAIAMTKSSVIKLKKIYQLNLQTSEGKQCFLNVQK